MKGWREDKCDEISKPEFNRMPELTSYTHTNLFLCLTDKLNGSISLFNLDAFHSGSVSVGVFHAFITYHGVKGKQK